MFSITKKEEAQYPHNFMLQDYLVNDEDNKISLDLLKLRVEIQVAIFSHAGNAIRGKHSDYE